MKANGQLVSFYGFVWVIPVSAKKCIGTFKWVGLKCFGTFFFEITGITDSARRRHIRIGLKPIYNSLWAVSF